MISDKRKMINNAVLLWEKPTCPDSKRTHTPLWLNRTLQLPNEAFGAVVPPMEKSGPTKHNEDLVTNSLISNRLSRKTQDRNPKFVDTKKLDTPI